MDSGTPEYWRERQRELAGDGIDPTVPHSARIWNYWLGGKDNYPVDREVGDGIARRYPLIVDMARHDRAFLLRAVRHLIAERGVRQFLDIGAGLPTVDNTHQVAQRIAPDARVVYVDNDPLVLAHARALLASTPEGACDYVDADLRGPEKILWQAARTLDVDRPVAVVLCAVLPHIDDEAAYSVVERLMNAVPSGSYLVVSHDTADGHPGILEVIEQFTASGGPPVKTRTKAEVARFAAGLDLVEPGVVWTSDWQPDPAPWKPTPVPQYALVARKP